MNILVGNSTEIGGNYSLFTETQSYSLTWQANPVESRFTKILDNGKEIVILRSGQTITDGSVDLEKTASDAIEVVEAFKEVVGTIAKTKIVDRSDLNALNLSEVLNAAAEPPAEDPEASDSAEG